MLEGMVNGVEQDGVRNNAAAERLQWSCSLCAIRQWSEMLRSFYYGENETCRGKEFMCVCVCVCVCVCTHTGFPHGSASKGSAYSAGGLGSIHGLGRYPGGGKGYPLQYFWLENSKDCVILGVPKSQTRLSDFLFTSLHIYIYTHTHTHIYVCMCVCMLSCFRPARVF